MGAQYACQVLIQWIMELLASFRLAPQCPAFSLVIQHKRGAETFTVSFIRSNWGISKLHKIRKMKERHLHVDTHQKNPKLGRLGYTEVTVIM